MRSGPGIGQGGVEDAGVAREMMQRPAPSRIRMQAPLLKRAISKMLQTA
jgi:hypothetical protein